MALVKAEQPASERSHPDVAVCVFGKSGHAGVQQSVLFAIGAEAGSIEPGQPSAIGTGPQFAVAGSEHGHRDNARQAIGGSEHFDQPVFVSNQALPVGADPQVSVAVGVHGPDLNRIGEALEPRRAGARQAGPIRHPDISLGVFVGAIDGRPLARLAGGDQLERGARIPHQAYRGAVPSDAGVIFHDIEDFVLGDSQMSGKGRRLDDPGAIPLEQSLAGDDQEVSARHGGDSQNGGLG